jgi:hypothetical protein
VRLGLGLLRLFDLGLAMGIGKGEKGLGYTYILL